MVKLLGNGKETVTKHKDFERKQPIHILRQKKMTEHWRHNPNKSDAQAEINGH